MATLLLDGISEQVSNAYEHASPEVKHQFTKVLEDIVQLWTQRNEEEQDAEYLRQEMFEFITYLPTFPLDWEHNKMTREEMNEG